MSEIITVPTVEQINLEHRLANNKAAEAVQHATNCGLMLLQVKASLNHGEWLPWLNGEIESGRLTIKIRQTQKYIRLASNTHRSAYLLEATSINAALELLTDQPEPEQQDLISVDVEAERAARIVAEQQLDIERAAREVSERQKSEFRQESNERRKKNRELEEQIVLLKKEQPANTVEKEVPPADYEATKANAAALEQKLSQVKAEQTRIIQSAIKAKLQGYQGEVDALETKKRTLEKQAKEYQDYLASLAEDGKQMEAQTRSIEKSRQALLDLADELAEYHPVNEKINRRWLALIEMHRAAIESMSLVFGDTKPAFTLVHGGA